MSPAGRPHVGRRTVLVVAGCLLVGALAVVAASRLASPEEAPAGNFTPVLVPPTDATPSPTTPSPSRSTPGGPPGPVQVTPSTRTVEDDDDDDDDDDRDDRDDD